MTFVLHVHLLQEIPPDWLKGLQAEPMDVGGGVVSTEGGEIHEGDRLEEPGSLEEEQEEQDRRRRRRRRRVRCSEWDDVN